MHAEQLVRRALIHVALVLWGASGSFGVAFAQVPLIEKVGTLSVDAKCRSNRVSGTAKPCLRPRWANAAGSTADPFCVRAPAGHALIAGSMTDSVLKTKNLKNWACKPWFPDSGMVELAPGSGITVPTVACVEAVGQTLTNAADRGEAWCRLTIDYGALPTR